MQSKHVLVVDDFKYSRDLYELCLSQQGFRVTLASDGQEALDKAFQLRPDVVIMDLSLPVLSGAEATRRLKADERTRHIPVLILSAYDSFGLPADVKCDGFLVKPCLPDKVVSEILRVLDKTSMESPSSATAAGAGEAS